MKPGIQVGNAELKVVMYSMTHMLGLTVVSVLGSLGVEDASLLDSKRVTTAPTIAPRVMQVICGSVPRHNKGDEGALTHKIAVYDHYHVPRGDPMDNKGRDQGERPRRGHDGRGELISKVEGDGACDRRGSGTHGPQLGARLGLELELVARYEFQRDERDSLGRVYKACR